MAEEVWFHIAFAPRDGSRVRVKSDAGFTYEAAFRAPYWWVVKDEGLHDLVLTDDVIYGDPMIFADSAVQWQVLS